MGHLARSRLNLYVYLHLIGIDYCTISEYVYYSICVTVLKIILLRINICVTI